MARLAVVAIDRCWRLFCTVAELAADDEAGRGRRGGVRAP